MDADELTIRIAGEAGQGMQTIGTALSAILKKGGYYLFTNKDYMSRIRGGNNFMQMRISCRPVDALRGRCDLMMALNRESINIHKGSLDKKGYIIADKGKFGIKEDTHNIIDVPLHKLALKTGGDEIYVNSVACGFIASLLHIDFSIIDATLTQIFAKKGKEVIENNRKAAASGYEYDDLHREKPSYKIRPSDLPEHLLIDGNQAIALGAIAAGCKFYTAYPMTPSTSILNTVAHHADRFNIVVEQAEDEIAAINMAVGASFAGVRAMTGTSGGGLALMGEGVSLAGMTETGVVIADSQRPGPATGLPTRTEQGDLNFAIHLGHGDFVKAVYSPGTIEEAFYLTIKAFTIAERYQIPVIILTDQHLADSVYNVKCFDLSKVLNKRFLISKKDAECTKNYMRYALTENGISPKAVPSWIKDVIYADSDEHTEEGHITESSRVRVSMMRKRYCKRLDLLRNEITAPAADNVEDADVVCLGFGSTRNVIKEACAVLKAEGNKIGAVHLPQVWPFPARQLQNLFNGKKRIITIENNAGAQLAGLLRRETGFAAESSILSYDGRPFSVDSLMDSIKERI